MHESRAENTVEVEEFNEFLRQHDCCVIRKKKGINPLPLVQSISLLLLRWPFPVQGSFVGQFVDHLRDRWLRGSPKVHLLHHVWYLSRYGDFMSKSVKTRYDVTPLNHFSQRDTVVSIAKPVLLYGIRSHVKEDLLFQPERTNNTDTSIVQYAGDTGGKSSWTDLLVTTGQ